MNNPDRLKIIQYHEARIQTYGIKSAMALGWNMTSTQQLRFGILADIAKLDRKTVLDIGCGRGDLRPILGQKYKGVQYTGMDQIPEFIELAKKQYGQLPNTTFLLGDFWTDPIPQADYILASGALNYANTDPLFIQHLITLLYKACGTGLGFNLLSKVGYPPGDLTAYDPDEILKFCRTLCKQVRYRDGYLDGDYTIFMYH